MSTVDYSGTIQRILDILQADTSLNKLVSEWRFGELPEQTMANSFPAVYVTMSSNPQVSRDDWSPSREDHEKAPIQQVTTEYWIVIISEPHGVPADSQKQAYTILGKINRLLLDNIRLRNPKEDEDDTMSDYLRISSQPRLTSVQGELVDSITIMVRVTTFE